MVHSVVQGVSSCLMPIEACDCRILKSKATASLGLCKRESRTVALSPKAYRTLSILYLAVKHAYISMFV